MAIVFRLANEGRTSFVDLYSGTLRLQPGTWQTEDGVAGERVLERMVLVGSDAGATLRAGVQALQDALRLAEEFHVGEMDGESWWFEWNADGETTKRALLYEGRRGYPTQHKLDPLLTRGALGVSLVFERHPFFEALTYSTKSTTGIGLTGGQYAYTGIQGKEDARLALFSIAPNTGMYLRRFWCGFRRKGAGVSNFESRWQCEDGVNVSGDATDVADGSASGGYKVQVTFSATTEMAERMRIEVADVCAAAGHTDYDHQRGRYVVLARAKVSAGTCALQAWSGYTSASSTPMRDPQYLSVTKYPLWRLVELGEIQIPPLSGAAFSDAKYAEHYGLSLYAQQVNGSGNLDLDCLILIPAEYHILIDNASVNEAAAQNRDAHIVVREDDSLDSYSEGNATVGVDDSLILSPQNWALPAGDGVLVMAGEQGDEHELGKSVDVTFDYYPRWPLYR